MLKLMYITKSPEIAKIAEKAGTDRIFVDLEKIGKELRQGGMNTVKSDHTVADVAAVRAVLTRAELLVRVNPIHAGSKEEIRSVIRAGADILMLPYFKTKEETDRFLDVVRGDAKTMLLVETQEAVENLDAILVGGGVDFVHVGINDLHLALHKRFMFEVLTDGTVEKICTVCRRHQVPYGFGGIAGIGKGLLPGELVLAEHYRLGSSAVILSRSFCNVKDYDDLQEIEAVFTKGIRTLRACEQELAQQPPAFFSSVQRKTVELVAQIAEGM